MLLQQAAPSQLNKMSNLPPRPGQPCCNQMTRYPVPPPPPHPHYYPHYHPSYSAPRQSPHLYQRLPAPVATRHQPYHHQRQPVHPHPYFPAYVPGPSYRPPRPHYPYHPPAQHYPNNPPPLRYPYPQDVHYPNSCHRPGTSAAPMQSTAAREEPVPKPPPISPVPPSWPIAAVPPPPSVVAPVPPQAPIIAPVPPPLQQPIVAPVPPPPPPIVAPVPTPPPVAPAGGEAEYLIVATPTPPSSPEHPVEDNLFGDYIDDYEAVHTPEDDFGHLVDDDDESVPFMSVAQAAALAVPDGVEVTVICKSCKIAPPKYIIRPCNHVGLCVDCSERFHFTIKGCVGCTKEHLITTEKFYN